MEFFIHKQSLAVSLIRLGNELMYCMPNKKVANKVVWCFARTEKLLEDLERLTR